MSKKIILKATKEAPEFVSQGNLDAKSKNGYFETTHRAFADSIIAGGYAVEVEKKESATPKRAAKTQSRRTKTDKTTNAAPEAETKTPAASSDSVETKPEGETK